VDTLGEQAAIQIPTGVITGAVDLTPEESILLDEALHHHFAHEAFRPGQADVIAALLRGEGMLAVMPTGAGKSLCYQLAALLLLVISPLIALMKDQLDGLPAKVTAQATTINSTLDGPEMATRLARAATGDYKLLYAAPERLRQRPFLHALKRAGISLLVVDEAHCVSLWGHDFRPDYRFIAKAWHELGEPPILAMTATATPRVRDDIQTALGKMRLVAIDVHRPNLKLKARRFAKDAEKQRSLLALCREIKGSGIVYAHSRVKCEQLAAMLRRNGISAIHYHAGIRDRAAAQDRFMCDQARIVVATIAFGMGVDKADVRFIIHYSPPKALENYYQEAGRAGRDGLPARCILFHTPQDRGRLTRFSRQDALHVEFLRRAYAALQRRLGPDGVGLLTVGDLERDLVADGTQLRVAIHFLETAGLLWRGFDLPRTASLTLRHAPDGDDLDFARFVEAAHLRIRQPVSRGLVAVSHDAGLDPRTVETKLLAWHDTGWLRYRGIGRDMLLALPEPPPDSQERVAAMLAEYHAGQEGRTAEMMAYATTRRCRHGYISAYFGGHPIESCQACDNCLGQATAHPRPTRRARPVSGRVTMDDLTPNEADALKTIILHGVARLPYPMGSTGLARALQGASSSSVQADRFPLFGRLTNWTQVSIREQISQLEDKGLLVAFNKGDYRLLRLSAAGQAWLKAQPKDIATATAPPPRPRTENLADYDEDLYQRLRIWRLARAREVGLPPYIILQDKVMKRIALSRPTTQEELAGVKGIGPRKLEQYGSAVLDIVASHRENSSQKEK
jgi:ATP-dependent DNA helicase RecQ